MNSFSSSRATVCRIIGKMDGKEELRYLNIFTQQFGDFLIHGGGHLLVTFDMVVIVGICTETTLEREEFRERTTIRLPQTRDLSMHP